MRDGNQTYQALKLQNNQKNFFLGIFSHAFNLIEAEAGRRGRVLMERILGWEITFEI